MADSPEIRSTHPNVRTAPEGGIRVSGRFYKHGQVLPDPNSRRSQINRQKYDRIRGGDYQGGRGYGGNNGGQIGQQFRPSADPARGVPYAAPNYGRDILPHILTFSGRSNTAAHVYRSPDAAIQADRQNARIMRRDCSIMECLEARQRGTALLNWHIEPEDKNDKRQKELVERLTKDLKFIRNFTEYRRNLLEALWYGRYAVKNRFIQDFSQTGKSRVVVNRWQPVHGDKLVFRYDDGSADYDPDQIGIRIGTAANTNDAIAGDRRLEPTDYGMAYFLEPWERSLIVLHRHMIEDAAFEDPISAGAIHGIGIRDRIYWAWFQKQECLAQLMELIEKTGQGITIYYFQSGNSKDRDEMSAVAEQQAHTNVLLMPWTSGDDNPRIQQIPANEAGIEAMRSIAKDFWGDQIKRYILGQTLSTEAAATGLGSGVADLHMESFSQIIRYDAGNLEETITRELLEPIKDYNELWAKSIRLTFKIDTESPEMEKKLQAVRELYEMGAKVKLQDAFDFAGLSIPGDGDEVLQNPQFMQQQRLWDRDHKSDGGGPTDPGSENPFGGSDPNDPNNPGDPSADGGGMGGSNPEEMNEDDMFGPLAGEGNKAGDEPEKFAAKKKYVIADERLIKYRIVHAPAGGASIAGKQFSGGQFIPSADLEKASDSEKSALGIGDVDIQHGKRHGAAADQLAAIDPKISGIMRALHSDPAYHSDGTVVSTSVHPEAAKGLYRWLQENEGGEAGGGKVVKLKNGKLGFASGAGSMVIEPPKSDDKSGKWKVGYTTQTKWVSDNAGVEHAAKMKEGGEGSIVQPQLADDEPVTATAIGDEPANEISGDAAAVGSTQAVVESAESTVSGGDQNADSDTKNDELPTIPAELGGEHSEETNDGGNSESAVIPVDDEKPTKQPHEMTREEFAKNNSAAQHKQHLKKAIAAGEKIDPKILADYPELAKQAGQPANREPQERQAELSPVKPQTSTKPTPGEKALRPKSSSVPDSKVSADRKNEIRMKAISANAHGYLQSQGLHVTPENIALLKSGIERGYIKSPSDVFSVLKTAKKLHQKGNLKDPSHPHLKESIRRKHNANERGTVGRKVRDAAKEHGVDAGELREAVDFLHENEHRETAEREAVKSSIRKSIGITEKQIAKWENEGKDYSSKGLPDFGDLGRQLAGEYPELGWGSGYVQGENADDTDYGRRLWDLLREGSNPIPSKNDEELIGQAVELLKGEGESKSAREPGDDESGDDHAFNHSDDTESAVPFSRAKSGELIQRYRAWKTEKTELTNNNRTEAVV